jgi:hypothetical protein
MCHVYRSFVVLSVFFALSTSAWAQKSASLLPRGIWRVRTVNVFTDPITQSLNSEGEAQSLVSALERRLTAKELAASNQNLAALYNGLNAFEYGLGDSLFAVDLMPQAEIQAKQMVFAAEYGITSKLSLGIIVPVSSVKNKASFKIQTYNEAMAVAQHVRGVAPLENGVHTFNASAPNAQTFEDAIFTSNGYYVPRDFEYTGLGDVEVGGKYQVYKNHGLSSALTAGVRLDTGTHKKDFRNILDQGTGDGQYDVAFELANEYQILPFLSLGLGSRYTIQLPNNETRPLLKSGQSGLPNLNDPSTFQKVRRNMGDYVETELGSVLKFWTWELNGAYMHYYKFSDSFSGPEAYQVAELESNTDKVSHRYEVGLKFTTLPLFAKKKFFMPLEAKIAYTDILAGRNVARSSYTRLDFIVYF